MSFYIFRFCQFSQDALAKNRFNDNHATVTLVNIENVLIN